MDLSQAIFCVNAAGNVYSSLRADNLRGERRWEKNVIDALVHSGRSTYFFVDNWQSLEQMPPNLKDKFVMAPDREKIEPNTIFIFHSAPANLVCTHPTYLKDYYIPYNGAGYVFNFFGPPGPEAVKELVDLAAKVGKHKLFITHGFQRSLEESQLQERLQKAGLRDRYFWLPGPMVPSIDKSVDNFDKKVLLWLYRQIYDLLYHISRCGNSKFIAAARTHIAWIAAKLKNNPSLRFIVATGYNGRDHSRWAAEGINLSTDILRHPIMSPLESVKEQVEIIDDLGWNQVLALLSNETKMLVNYPMRYGGPNIEAGSVGIPTVGLRGTSPFIDMHGYVYVEDYWDPNLQVQYEKMFAYHDYYRRLGDDYRNYVERFYTYDAFIRNLDSILQTTL